MKTVTRDILYTEISRFNQPTIKIKSGETVKIATELNTGNWLHSATDVWSPEKQIGRPNPASGCIDVEGAKPGQMIAIKILDIEILDLGYTGFAPGMNPFPDWIRDREWGIVTKTVKIENGFIIWNDKLKIAIEPMVGFIGTAPAIGVPDNTANGTYGGNLDIQEATIGSTVFLPVYVEGALLHIGDVHAIQGDGEICCAGGIETRSMVTIQVDLLQKPPEMIWPRIETSDHIISIGCARPAEDAFRIAVKEMIKWMVASFGFSETAAFLLLGQILQARCTQFVNPLYTYICKVKKEFLAV